MDNGVSQSGAELRARHDSLSPGTWLGPERRRTLRGDPELERVLSPDAERDFSLAGLALRNSHLIVVLSLLIAILGVLAYHRLPTDLLPAAHLPAVQVVSFYSGMPVREVEKNLTERLERYTGEAVGMERQESRSLVGVSVIRNYFGASTDLNTALAHTTASVMTALRKLPPGTMPPLILPFDPMASTPLALVAVSGNFSESHLFDVARHEIGNAIQAVPGAMAPTIMGGSERQITAYLDPKKLVLYNFSPLTVLNRLVSLNTLIPSGDVLFGDIDYQVESNGSVGKVEEMNEFPLRSENGVTVRMKDVGRVEDAKAIQTNVVMVDGKRQVYVPVFRQPGANTIEVVQSVKAAMARQEKIMKDYRFRVVMDQSAFIRHAIASISEEAWIGGAMAALMVLLFLGSFRATGAILLSLPLSILPAFLGLSIFGHSINAMTLGGLALSIGVLVDNSIVVIENIMHKNASGVPPLRAALEGTREVGMPVLASTLVTLIVFLPVLFLTGVVKTLFSALAVAVVCAMIGSYLVAMTVVPLFAARFLNGRGLRRPQGFLKRCQDVIGRVTLRYGSALRWTLSRRRAVLVGTTVTLLAASALAARIGTELFPRADAGNLVLQVRLKSGLRVEATAAFAERLDAKLREWIEPGDLAMIVANAGVYYGFPAAFTTNSGSQDVFLNVELTDRRRHTSQHYARLLRERLPHTFPEAEVSIQLGGLLSSALNGGLPAPIDVQIRGPKGDQSHALATELARKVRRLPGAVDVRVKQRLDSPKLVLDIDRQAAGALGLTPEEVLKNVVAALRSSVTFHPAVWVDPKKGVAYQFGVQFRESDAASREQLLDIPVSGPRQDRGVPLRRIAKLTEAKGPTEINHVNLVPVVDIYLDAQGRDVGGLAADVAREIAAMKLPPGYSMEIRGEIAEMRSAIAGLAGGFLLAALFVYLLLVVQFRSYLLPLIIMTTVPLALVGIVLALVATDTYFSIQAAIGAVFMIGVAVAHGVLLIEFILHHVRNAPEGDLDEAILRGAMARLRPIAMTALASILALVPMALGMGLGSEANIPLGRAVIGGQILSTTLTLFLVPCLFRLLYRGRVSFGARTVVLPAASLLLALLPFPAEARELSLRETLGLAAKASPELGAARTREVAAQSAVGGARSGYYPVLTVEAADSTGFSGSGASLGIAGLVGSPFRGGASAGAVARVPIWDFGRTSGAVETAKHRARELELGTRLSRIEILQRALRAYLECAKSRTLRDEWKTLTEETEGVAEEVKRFVRTGQRPALEANFADAQTEEAAAALADVEERYLASRRDLEALSGMRADTVDCHVLPAEADLLSVFGASAEGSPLVEREQASYESARANLDRAKAGYLPRLNAFLSAGAMQSANPSVKQDFYAAGVALVVPVFDGFRTDSDVGEAAALAEGKALDVAARKLELARWNIRFDGAIGSSRARLKHLDEQIRLAQRALVLAKHRYAERQGSVIDVREALRGLFRPTVDHAEARAMLLEAMGAKALWNGADLRAE